MRVTAVSDGVGAPGREAAKKALRIVISLSLFAIVIWFADWRAVEGVLRSASPKWVVVALGLVVVDRMVLNWRWQVLLAAQGVPVAFGRLFRVQLAANF